MMIADKEGMKNHREEDQIEQHKSKIEFNKKEIEQNLFAPPHSLIFITNPISIILLV